MAPPAVADLRHDLGGGRVPGRRPPGGGPPRSGFRSQNWALILGEASSCLAVAGLYLYFWIVVLELFVKMGPFYSFDGVVFSQVPPVPMHQVTINSNDSFKRSTEFSFITL